MEIIDGKKVSNELKENIRLKISELSEKPGLAVVIVGNDPASQVYVRHKHIACEKLGITSLKYELEENISEQELLDLIDKLNNDDKVNGILVQMPLPKHMDANKIIEAILPDKDVDGFHANNVGKLSIGLDSLTACTPTGVIKLLDYYNIDISGKEVVVVGRSNIVGKPVASMLINRSATVTVCHSRTKDLAFHTKRADIIIAAVGIKHFIKSDMIAQGCVIIDVGINRDGDKLYGDVDFEGCKNLCSYITPVPGGVGPMTIACLMENTLKAYEIQHSKNKINN